MYESNKRNLALALSVLTLLGAVSSCEDPGGPKEERRVGVVAYYGDPVVVTAPDTVLAGEPFSVSVRTYGDGCVSKDGTEVQSADLTVDITPYDVHSGARFCTDILNMFDHALTLNVAQSGTALLRFHGKQLPGDVSVTEPREVIVK